MSAMDSPFNKKRFPQNPTIRLSRRVMTRRVPIKEIIIDKPLISLIRPVVIQPVIPVPEIEIYHKPEPIEEPVSVVVEKKTRKKRK